MDIGSFLDAIDIVSAGHLGAPAWRRDCCIFVRDVCAIIAPTWPVDLNMLWCIYADDDGRVPPHRVFGPAHAAAKVFGGPTLSTPPSTKRHALARLSVCQGWHDLRDDGSADPALGDRGHTWFWLSTGEDGRGIRVDSSRRRGVRVHGIDSWATLQRAYGAGIGHSPIAQEVLR